MYHIVEARIREALGAFLSRRGDRRALPRSRSGRRMWPWARWRRRWRSSWPSGCGARRGRSRRRLPPNSARFPASTRVETAGAGYVNFFFDRAAFFSAAISAAPDRRAGGRPPPRRAESAWSSTPTSIPIRPRTSGICAMPRWATRSCACCGAPGRRVEVQNYIDNTGVQVADVVVGFQHIGEKVRRRSARAGRRAALRLPVLGLVCAGHAILSKRTRARLALRGETLAAIEEGHGAAAELAEIVSVAIARCHLRTMERLGVQYDVLPRESEILHLKFWEAAFAQLKQRGAIHLADDGQECGLLGDESDGQRKAGRAATRKGADDDAKVIVRSNGTVTYVGKDIAYQLWKFGLLGRDFALPPFPHAIRTATSLWTSAADGGEAGAPAFGHADRRVST